MFFCDICPASFVKREELRLHESLDHPETRPWPCTHCELRFRQKGNLRSHQRSVHGMEDAYPCPHCTVSFGTAASALRHAQLHDYHIASPYDPVQFACEFPDCDHSYASSKHLRSHHRAFHRVRIYPCASCGESLECTQQELVQQHKCDPLKRTQHEKSEFFFLLLLFEKNR